MGKKIQLDGNRYGRLVVLEETDKRDVGGNVIWKCKCDCGKITYTSAQNLRRGYTQSCGCYNKEIITKKNPDYKKKLYYIYHAIKCRCNNPKDRAYHNYGARGIKLSKRWNTFKKFEEWALKNGYKDGLWIDRIDNDKNYSPYNCRWVTPKEQQNNKRTNRFITIGTETKTIQEWADATGINPMTITRRIELGWKGEDIIKPVDKRYSHSELIKEGMRKATKI